MVDQTGEGKIFNMGSEVRRMVLVNLRFPDSERIVTQERGMAQNVALQLARPNNEVWTGEQGDQSG